MTASTFFDSLSRFCRVNDSDHHDRNYQENLAKTTEVGDQPPTAVLKK
jgi:hypothetical protein